MTITEVSKKLDIPQDTLRYYERIGLIPPVNRTKGGIRNYSEDDCKWVEFIKCMRSAGLPIEVLIEYVNLFQQGDETIQRRFGGTGLGLPISARLVGMLKGRIQVSSLPGRGTRFIVTLPLTTINARTLRPC